MSRHNAFPEFPSSPTTIDDVFKDNLKTLTGMAAANGTIFSTLLLLPPAGDRRY